MKLMTSRKVALALMTGVIAVALVGTAMANETAHMNTGGSLLIDHTKTHDVFGHRAAGHGSYVEINSGYTSFYGDHAWYDHGSARVFHMMDDYGILIGLNNNSFGNNVRDYAWGTTLMSTEEPDDELHGQMLDVTYVKSDVSFGVVVGIQKNYDGYDNTTFGAKGSIHRENHQFAAEATMSKPEHSGDDDTDYDSQFDVAALYRGDYENGKTAHLGVYMHKPGGDSDIEDKDTAIGIMASYGEKVIDTDRSQMSCEVVVDYQRNVDYGQYNTLFVPGFRVGVDHELTSVFDFQAGVRASWGQRTENDDDDAPGIGVLADEHDTVRRFFYDYTLGLGANFGNVSMDFNVHPEAIPHLTRFGSDDHIFGSMSVEIGFD